MAQKLLGSTGEYAVLFLILMAVMSTGSDTDTNDPSEVMLLMLAAHRSAEVIAVASIIIYDVYQAYVCPFRPGLEPGQCILCGAWHRPPHPDHPGPLCQCPSADNCEGCKVSAIIHLTIKS